MTQTIRTDAAPVVVVVPRRSRFATAFVVLLALCVAAFAILAIVMPPDGGTRGDTWRFVGRLHPALVHLPIGMLALVPILEIAGLPLRWRHLRGAAGFVLGLGTIGSVVAVGLGYTLARADGNRGETLTYHMIAGLVTAALSVAALGLRLRATAGLRRPLATIGYVICLAGLMAVLTITGHLGGQLTYGEAYFSSVAPRPIARFLGPIDGDRVPAPPIAKPDPSPAGQPSTAPSPATAPSTAPAAAAVSFARDVMPVFNATCVSCHGPSKVKGGLRLDSFAELSKGGDGGESVIAGNAETSELYRRMVLPMDDDEVMPPANAKQRPTAEQIAGVKRWIEAGAKDD